MMSIKTQLLAVAALTLAAVTLVAAAGAAGVDTQTADVRGQGAGGPVVAQDGATLQRSDSGLSAKLSMPTPEPGTYLYPPAQTKPPAPFTFPAAVPGHPEAYSLWVFVFNYPALCSVPCDSNDLGAATPARNLTPEQDTIARFWSDDPGQTATPPGHSISIATQMLRTEDSSLATAAEAYAKVGLAVCDAFIACWYEKYVYNLLRPVTYIQRLVDPAWLSVLVTPPFPEYTSGHSVQSGAAFPVLSDCSARTTPSSTTPTTSVASRRAASARSSRPRTRPRSPASTAASISGQRSSTASFRGGVSGRQFALCLSSGDPSAADGVTRDAGRRCRRPRSRSRRRRRWGASHQRRCRPRARSR
jgi:hypothetical protein